MRSPVTEVMRVLTVLVLASGLVSVAALAAACGSTAPEGGQAVPGASSPSSSGAGASTPSPADSAAASLSPNSSPTRARTPSPTSAATGSACPSDNATRSWFYLPDDAHRVPTIPADVRRLLRTYGGRYVGDTEEKVVYLTFDEGYENGYTGEILDALRDAGVTAAFFVTGGYVRDNPDLVRRMAGEDHVVANHTNNHPSLPSLAGDRAAFAGELTRVETAFRRATGERLARLLRPPMGEYSARSLCLTARLGYTTVFWSFAHRDWLTDDQPPVRTTVRRALEGSHPGAVYLLHAVSSSNAAALPAIIRGLRAQGYRIGSPTELLEG